MAVSLSLHSLSSGIDTVLYSAKRFVLNLSYPTALWLCLTLKTACFTFSDFVVACSTKPVLLLPQIIHHYRPSVKKKSFTHNKESICSNPNLRSFEPHTLIMDPESLLKKTCSLHL